MYIKIILLILTICSFGYSQVPSSKCTSSVGDKLTWAKVKPYTDPELGTVLYKADYEAASKFGGGGFHSAECVKIDSQKRDTYAFSCVLRNEIDRLEPMAQFEFTFPLPNVIVTPYVKKGKKYILGQPRALVCSRQ